MLEVELQFSGPAITAAHAISPVFSCRTRQAVLLVPRQIVHPLAGRHRDAAKVQWQQPWNDAQQGQLGSTVANLQAVRYATAPGGQRCQCRVRLSTRW